MISIHNGGVRRPAETAAKEREERKNPQPGHKGQEDVDLVPRPRGRGTTRSTGAS